MLIRVYAERRTSRQPVAVQLRLTPLKAGGEGAVLSLDLAAL